MSVFDQSSAFGVAELSMGRRRDHLERLQQEVFDLAIVGGGITGAGIAADATTRGLRVALVEKSDFASGTSSRSTKLIHGGLRYLAQYEFGLTHEALSERRLLQRLAPVLVEPLPFLLPMYSGTFETLRIGAGLWLYDLLAGMHRGMLHHRLNVRETRRRAPGLEQHRLGRSFVYYDCRTDDARLTLEVLRTAVSAGAATANYVEACGFARAKGRVVGVECRDSREGHEFLVRARRVVVACGVWLNDVLAPGARGQGAVHHSLIPASQPLTPTLRVRPSKGVHLIVSRERFGAETAFLLPSEKDNRLIFVVPWQRHTLIGTTDTEYQGDLDAPRATTHDLEYLLDVVNRRFPDASLGVDDVLGVTAGLRPLVDDGEEATTSVSREDRIVEAEDGLIAIAGGKLTTYRRMARKIVDLVVRRLAEAHEIVSEPICATARVPIGAFGRLRVSDSRDFRPLAEIVDESTRDYLVRTYGANAERVLELARGQPELCRPLLPGQPTLAAEVVYAARHEMATAVSDFLARRTHLTLFDREQAIDVAPVVARLLGEEHGWSESEIATAVAEYERDAVQYSVRDLR